MNSTRTLPTKVHLIKAMVFLVVMYGCESWTLKSWAQKSWCFWTVVLEKTLLRVPWTARRSNQAILRRSVLGDVEAETPILWPSDAESWLTWKDPDAGKDWGQEEKGTTEDEMVGLHHWLNGHGFGETLRVGDGQGSLACWGSWGLKRVRHDSAIELNWTRTYLHGKR